MTRMMPRRNYIPIIHVSIFTSGDRDMSELHGYLQKTCFTAVTFITDSLHKHIRSAQLALATLQTTSQGSSNGIHGNNTSNGIHSNENTVSDVIADLAVINPQSKYLHTCHTCHVCQLTYCVVASKLDEILFMGRVSRMLYSYSTKLKDILNTTSANSHTNSNSNTSTTATSNKRDMTHTAKLHNSSSNSSIPRSPSLKSIAKKEGESSLMSFMSALTECRGNRTVEEDAAGAAQRVSVCTCCLVLCRCQ
jgi:hypothetical protein